MAAMSGKIVQKFLFVQCCQQNRQSSTLYRRDCCTPNMHNMLPLQGGKFAWTGISAMQLRTLSKNQTGFINRGTVYCNAAPSTAAIPSLEKVNFLKLQNGSDIRGVAIAGVEGEPVNLTLPVTEAIAAAFAAWLLDKKKPAGSKRLRVSIGHDSRISAQELQDAVSRGISGGGLDVIQYGLASTPAMFNSTLTEDDDFFCPADGSIMITASHLPYNRNGFKFFTNAGGLGKADIKDILERAANIYSNFTVEGLKDAERRASSSVKMVDYMAIYTSALVAAVRKAAGSIVLSCTSNPSAPIRPAQLVIFFGPYHIRVGKKFRTPVIEMTQICRGYFTRSYASTIAMIHYMAMLKQPDPLFFGKFSVIKASYKGALLVGDNPLSKSCHE